jgi:hypothetical protein
MVKLVTLASPLTRSRSTYPTCSNTEVARSTKELIPVKPAEGASQAPSTAKHKADAKQNKVKEKAEAPARKATTIKKAVADKKRVRRNKAA